MSFFATTVAYGSTGVKTITVGFAPTWIRVTVGQAFATAQGFTHYSYGIGWNDGANESEHHTIFQDTSGGKTESGAKLFSIHERISGTITEVLAGTFDSFTATAAKINVSVANANYNLLVEIGN